jgi:hypothetical protein
MTEGKMDDAEARRILENLARNGPPTAQVAAIKVLRDMDKEAKAAADAEAAQAVPPGFEGLYDATCSPRSEGDERLSARLEHSQHEAQ